MKMTLLLSWSIWGLAWVPLLTHIVPDVQEVCEQRTPTLRWCEVTWFSKPYALFGPSAFIRAEWPGKCLMSPGMLICSFPEYPWNVMQKPVLRSW